MTTPQCVGCGSLLGAEHYSGCPHPIQPLAFDPDGWQRPRDLKDEALEDMRQQLAAARSNEARAWERVRLLEARMDDIREALVKR